MDQTHEQNHHGHCSFFNCGTVRASSSSINSMVNVVLRHMETAWSSGLARSGIVLSAQGCNLHNADASATASAATSATGNCSILLCWWWFHSPGDQTPNPPFVCVLLLDTCNLLCFTSECFILFYFHNMTGLHTYTHTSIHTQ